MATDGASPVGARWPLERRQRALDKDEAQKICRRSNATRRKRAIFLRAALKRALQTTRRLLVARQTKRRGAKSGAQIISSKIFYKSVKRQLDRSAPCHFWHAQAAARFARASPLAVVAFRLTRSQANSQKQCARARARERASGERYMPPESRRFCLAPPLARTRKARALPSASGVGVGCRFTSLARWSAPRNGDMRRIAAATLARIQNLRRSHATTKRREARRDEQNFSRKLGFVQPAADESAALFWTRPLVAPI